MKNFIPVKKCPRKNFSKIDVIASIPNLIEVQKNSYEKHFLQLGAVDDARKNQGLENVFRNILSISDSSNSSSLEYVRYRFDIPKYDVEECKQRNLTYSAPLKVTLRLIVWDLEEDTGSRDIKSIKEQEVYMGDIPMMTSNGTFIVNGVERVVVSQMHRSPGVFFDHDKGRVHATGKFLYSARVIPYRGSWLDIEFDGRDLIHFRIDRKRKLYITTLLYALGMTKRDIVDYFYQKTTYMVVDKKFVTAFIPERVSIQKLENDLVDADTGNIILKADQKITPRLAKKYKSEGLNNINVYKSELIGKFLGEDLVNKLTGEVVGSLGDEITDEIADRILDANMDNFCVLLINSQCGPYIRNTLFVDRNDDAESALIDIFRILRPGEPATIDAAKSMFLNLFSSSSRYDLSEVGRVKINARIDSDVALTETSLLPDDIKKIIKVLINLKDGKGSVDDIDHLGNRRVRSVGELIENQFVIGLIRIQKSVLERINIIDPDSVMPHDLINSKLLVAVIKEFFGTSQLSQFMDQTNPLSEITHKRRLSALGPGGLNRERAGAEVRDVHVTHYGRICPIETPEGQNIGLISSLATFASINKYGFIESPYRKVVDGQITNEVQYLSAIEEGRYKIAPVAEYDKKGMLKGEYANARVNGDFLMIPVKDINYIGVVPMQLVSVATSLIPFLENNDANRALMGANMQRQAVPLLKSQAPFVGTGIEYVVAKDSGAAVVAKYDGIVEMVDASKIVVKTLNGNGDYSPEVEIYNLVKFQRSNHNTCINQVPLVSTGQRIIKGDIIADGPCIDQGEIAIGKNVLVAFLPWSGHNFKDSIVISERVVRDDVFTSVHIEGFDIIARDTRLGPEEITRDIPNVGEEHLSHLDEVGIVHIGAYVKAGDILVGKVTPKSDAPTTSEEKLLRAIFGEKAADVRDSSLRVPPGVDGTVVEVRVFSRRGTEKDERTLSIEKQQIDKLTQDKDDKLSVIEHFVKLRFIEILADQIFVSGAKSIKQGAELSKELLFSLSIRMLGSIHVEDEKVNNELNKIKDNYELQKATIDNHYKSKVDKIQSGDDLPQGALKVVKVFIATKHKLQQGDKMSGRHGNKGIVSQIVSEADMPFLEDGTVVDIVLNPLGIPSRMNIGQILETHLGWASHNLGKKISQMLDDYNRGKENVDELLEFVTKIYGEESLFIQELNSMSVEEKISLFSQMKEGIYFSTPVFDGAKIDDVKHMLDLAGVKNSGQVRMIDGRYGEFFDREVTVGYKYMLKLHHLVDDKIHARSIGPYSLVTQQPLGGKSHFGGQRVGEMECWAIQAYGAAYILQEMLTVKSDDITGRIKIYESIIRGDNTCEYGVPESFNVMLKELRSLCLNVQLLK
jgi:DNA-directed RNA polymerase subunit beta